METRLGDTVLYRITQEDADQINRRRADAAANMPVIRHSKTGYMAHYGLEVTAGHQLPAFIICIDNQVADLQVGLPGNDILWAPRRREGDGLGLWQAR